MSEPTTQTGTSQDFTPGPIERFVNGRGLRIALALMACFFAWEGSWRLAEAKWWPAAWDLALASFFALGALPRHESRWWSVAFIIVAVALPLLFVALAVRWWSRFGF